MVTMVALWALQSGVAEAKEKPGTEIVVRLVDAKGAPLLIGNIRVAEEQWDSHSVNGFDGTWAATELYTKDGHNLSFREGEQYTIVGSAPGFAAQSVIWTVPPGKHVALDVPVVPIDVGTYADGPSFSFSPESLAAIADPATASLDDIAAFGRLMVAASGHHAEVMKWTGLALDIADAEHSGDEYVARKDRLLGIRAVSANAEWIRARTELNAAPSDEIDARAREMQGQVERLSRAWAEYDLAAGQSAYLAQQLCGSAAPDPLSCPQ